MWKQNMKTSLMGSISRRGLEDSVSMSQGTELPLTKGVLRAEVRMEQPGDVGDVACCAPRGQAGLGPCTVSGSWGHWSWLEKLTERWEGA